MRQQQPDQFDVATLCGQEQRAPVRACQAGVCPSRQQHGGHLPRLLRLQLAPPVGAAQIPPTPLFPVYW